MNNVNLKEYSNMIEVLKKSLWNTGKAYADETTFYQMKQHAIAALAAPVLLELGLSDELFRSWEKECINTFARYQQYIHIQSLLPLSIPYVILKGTSAAKYYPFPEFRTMGDIDIMTRHEEFKTADAMLLADGYKEVNKKIYIDRIRHKEYVKDHIEIELHSYYAYRNEPEESRMLDNLIISNINGSHVLPDFINGLTLIEHINFHMESGIGLRQIIDWMMFADKCLVDEKWPVFQTLASQTGHEKLAIVVTRMCELFLGLSEHKWCSNADPDICEKLMEYILGCGNFGRNQAADRKASTRFLMNTKDIRSIINYLQNQGLVRWKTARKYSVLRPFAWMSQGIRYLRKGLFRKKFINKLKEEYIESQRRDELFDAIQVTRQSKGVVCFKNGKYVKIK